MSWRSPHSAPPGVKASKEKGGMGGDTEYKYEWQRRAPGEKYTTHDTKVRNQPRWSIGSQVQNESGVTPAEGDCPLLGLPGVNSSSLPTEVSGPSRHPLELIAEMRDSGHALKWSVLESHLTTRDLSQDYVASDSEDDPNVDVLKSLTTKQKLQRDWNDNKVTIKVVLRIL